jgi:hypothetical protein
VTATLPTFPIRVMVTDAWDQVALQVSLDMTIAEVRRQALVRALVQAPDAPESYEVKFRGALVLNDNATLRELGVGPNAALIVLPAKRRPTR